MEKDGEGLDKKSIYSILSVRKFWGFAIITIISLFKVLWHNNHC